MVLVKDVTDTAFAEDDNSASVVKPYVLSHGTLAVKDIVATRRFYEEFLGLTTVRHAPVGFSARCGMKFTLVCLELGPEAEPANFHNHWGLDVASREEVQSAYDAAVRLKDEYGIRRVIEPVDQHGVFSFYMIDLDHNYWEIQYFPSFVHDDIFDFGDRFGPQGQSLALVSA